MTDRVSVGDIAVARSLYDFVNEEALPGTGVTAEAFWTGLDAIVRDLAPENRALLEKRDRLQSEIDRWHRDRRGKNFDLAEYKDFLEMIGYLLPEGSDFSITTANVDPEIAEVAGPQLVVPVMNARYALNAANARWGSLYDALYGTDAIPDDGGARVARATIPCGASASSISRAASSTKRPRSTARPGATRPESWSRPASSASRRSPAKSA